MPDPIPDSELEAYLDEALPVADMARIEQALRDDPRLGDRLAAIHLRRDSGAHSVGEIWRKYRLSCPRREELGTYLLGVLPEEAADYLRFHLEVVGCRFCQAEVEDLRRERAESRQASHSRRHRFFQSSAGYLRNVER
jgi:anti-sigma factor RsiW